MKKLPLGLCLCSVNHKLSVAMAIHKAYNMLSDCGTENKEYKVLGQNYRTVYASFGLFFFLINYLILRTLRDLFICLMP